MMYSPYGMGFGGYNPYGYGMGGFDPYMMGGYQMPFYGFGANSGFGDFNPYENFFSSFEQKMNDMLANYQKQLAPGTENGSTTPPANSATPPANSATPPAVDQVTKEAAKAVSKPDLGNLGARFDQGKGLTKRANKKLTKMGYTQEQLQQAASYTGANPGMAGFQANLAAMTPGVMSATNTQRGQGGRNTPRMA